MHHSVNHLITHGNIDQAAHATTAWLEQILWESGASSADLWRMAINHKGKKNKGKDRQFV